VKFWCNLWLDSTFVQSTQFCFAYSLFYPFTLLMPCHFDDCANANLLLNYSKRTKTEPNDFFDQFPANH